MEQGTTSLTVRQSTSLKVPKGRHIMSTQQILSRPVAAPEAFLTGPTVPIGTWKATRPFARFLLWLFAIPAVLYVTAIPLVRMPSYERWGPSHWGPILDFAWNTSGLDADVVVFGDSSAFLGIDPRLVDEQLHLKTVVLPNTVGSLPVTGDQALESYLAHNTKPRLIVLYFTAWDLNYESSADTRLYEGEEMLLRHDTPAQIARFALKHPWELPAFPLRNYSTVGPKIAETLLHGDDREAETSAALGHVDDREDYPPASPDCRLPTRYLNAGKTDSVRALAQKYRGDGYAVAVYLAPLPACSNAVHFANRTYAGLALAPAASLPAGSFKQDGFYAHVIPESVPTASRLFADTLERHTTIADNAYRNDAPTQGSRAFAPYPVRLTDATGPVPEAPHLPIQTHLRPRWSAVGANP